MVFDIGQHSSLKANAIYFVQGNLFRQSTVSIAELLLVRGQLCDDLENF